ncbi:MAG: aspartate-semialdehyde dehydrogenase [Candidatus Omnitrophota bacterium]
MKRYNVAVVGVGAVGIQMLRCLRTRNFPIKELRVFARRNRDILVDGITYKVDSISPGGFEGIDIALFAGTEGDKGAAVTFAPEAIKRGAVVIDNGADFRMKKDVPLVVPEINAKDITKNKGIIANPNCSTIQMVLAIYPIYKKFGIKRIIVTTFQAASGAGRGAVEQLFSETKEVIEHFDSRFSILDSRLKLVSSIQYPVSRNLPQQLAFNVFPHIGGFQEYNYTSEEWKMVHETRKILHDNKIKVSATCVRVPVRTGHSEAVYIETKKNVPAKTVKGILSRTKGIKVVDNPDAGTYPLPLDCEGNDDVFVGRIRNDPFQNNGLWLWVVSDNLIKGAALNAVQIAEFLIHKSKT